MHIMSVFIQSGASYRCAATSREPERMSAPRLPRDRRLAASIVLSSISLAIMTIVVVWFASIMLIARTEFGVTVCPATD